MPCTADYKFALNGGHISKALVLVISAQLLHLSLFPTHIQGRVIIMVQIIHLVVVKAFQQTKTHFLTICNNSFYETIILLNIKNSYSHISFYHHYKSLLLKFKLLLKTCYEPDKCLGRIMFTLPQKVIYYKRGVLCWVLEKFTLLVTYLVLDC